MELIWKSKPYTGQYYRTPEWTSLKKYSIFQYKKKEELYTSSYFNYVSIKDAILSHSWQELIGNGTASQQCKISWEIIKFTTKDRAVITKFLHKTQQLDILNQ